MKRVLILGAMTGIFLTFTLVFSFINPNEALAGSCVCSMGGNRILSIVDDKCDIQTEFGKCDLNQPGFCSCIKKPQTTPPGGVESCGCAQGQIQSDNCGSGKWAKCVGSNMCQCSSTPRSTSQTPAMQGSSYDPRCQTPSGPGVNTALGCIPVQTSAFVQWLLPKLFGIAGGISFLLMVYGFIQMTLSSGDPKAIQAAQETVSSAIIGLVVSLFALFLLRLIAVQILHIPGINAT